MCATGEAARLTVAVQFRQIKTINVGFFSQRKPAPDKDNDLPSCPRVLM